jgi:hypothetical protein
VVEFVPVNDGNLSNWVVNIIFGDRLLLSPSGVWFRYARNRGVSSRDSMGCLKQRRSEYHRAKKVGHHLTDVTKNPIRHFIGNCMLATW